MTKVFIILYAGLSPGAGRAQPLADQDQARPHLLQAPPAQDHEGALPDQPEPRLQGAQDALAEDWPRQEGPPGEASFQKVKGTVQQKLRGVSCT